MRPSQTLGKLFSFASDYARGKSHHDTKAGPGRRNARRKLGLGNELATRGGSYAGTPYLTYAEHDRICRDTLAARLLGQSRKLVRQWCADAVLDHRRTGAA